MTSSQKQKLVNYIKKNTTASPGDIIKMFEYYISIGGTFKDPDFDRITKHDEIKKYYEGE
jgi:hypothetical protein